MRGSRISEQDLYGEQNKGVGWYAGEKDEGVGWYAGEYNEGVG